MRRREFITLLGGAAATWPLAARAQKQTAKVPRVGYLFSFTPAEGQHLWEACRLGLRELGYVEGRNILLEPRWAGGRHDRLPDLARELVRLPVDVLVAAATPASLAAKAATGTIPIVMVAVGDPVKVGLVSSLARPGGNITGLSLLTPELSGRRLQLLVEMSGRAGRVAALINPDNDVHAVFLEETRAAAAKLGVKLETLRARNDREIQQAFEAAGAQRAEGMVFIDDPVLWSHRKLAVALAARYRLPVVYGYSEFVDEGGLISYGPDRPEQYRRTAAYVDRILKGVRPANLPIEQPTRFELVVNMKTAKALNVKLPQSILVQATRVIE
ncbi:MAG: ABC transporter substrate-binding protein [Burkholderiales bacterium]